MNYIVEDLSSIEHTDDLMSGFINPDEITYGIITPTINNTPNVGAPNWNSAQPSPTPNGFKMSDIDPELVDAAISTTGALIGMAASGSRKTEVEQQLKATCGRRPLIGKGRKEAYRNCANQALQTLMGVNSNGGRSGVNNGRNSDWNNQSGGISTGAVIGIVAGVVAVGALIVVLANKKA